MRTDSAQLTEAGPSGPGVRRLRVRVAGRVQGVGFRPFVYRLARRFALAGSVRNDPRGVLIEIEGGAGRLDRFLRALRDELPPHASISTLLADRRPVEGDSPFRILESEVSGDRSTPVPLDTATCPACRAELFDPASRRYRHPFITCAHCGPRYSIIRALPYDRSGTTMGGFPMCPRCRAEYEDPSDRRFHAQAVACPECGPRLRLLGPRGRPLADGSDALDRTVRVLAKGGIVAVKGLGGFHLVTLARDEVAVGRLRAAKHRDRKPFALMYPDLASVEADGCVGPVERRLLISPEAPIVLLRRRDPARPQPAVDDPVAAVPNPLLGVMLPYTPLHHLILHDLGRSVVATSGNRADEPICTDADQVLERLAGVADVILDHDRPIARHLDDSIVRVIGGRPVVLRLGRGHAPLYLDLSRPGGAVLAAGAHQKNAVALAAGRRAILGQHVGDLDTPPARRSHRTMMEALESLHDVRPAAVAVDAHPDYASTRAGRSWAARKNLPVHHVQHHHAHALACLADNRLDPPALAVTWDGAGYGPEDGTIWGGEFLLIEGDFSCRRLGHLWPFRLPGGEAAAREPRRSALGLLCEVLGDAAFERDDLPPVGAFSHAERALLRQALRRGLNAPLTTSAGRVFDGVAALLGVCQRAAFEAQAAMELEFAGDAVPADGEAYPIEVHPSAGRLGLDWRPALRALLADRAGGGSRERIARRFHRTLAEGIRAMAVELGQPTVLLTGGCFQNRLLTEQTIDALRGAGLEPVRHRRVPPGDGGVALGQVLATAYLNKE